MPRLKFWIAGEVIELALNLTNMTLIKRKATKRKSQFKTDIKEPDTFVTFKPRFTNFTTKKEKHSSGKYSSKTIIQKLEALESLSLEDSLQDLPSIEDHIAEVERLIEKWRRSWWSISTSKLRFYFAISKIFRKNIPLYNGKINLEIVV